MDRVGAEGGVKRVAHPGSSPTPPGVWNLLKSLGGEFERRGKIPGRHHSFGRTANGLGRPVVPAGLLRRRHPLGSQNSDCCRIDSIAQSFSIPRNPTQRRAIALNNIQYLFDRKNKFVGCSPALENSRTQATFKAGPGFRENGGQYTHAAVWLVQALLREGRFQDSYEMLKALLPANHDLAVYEAEPYVIAADVYANPDYTGRAGWSWYTGSSGWLYRVCVEDFLGLRPRGGRLYIEPRIPQNWEGYSAVWRSSDGTEHRIDVHRGEIFVDGQDYDGTGIPM